MECECQHSHAVSSSHLKYVELMRKFNSFSAYFFNQTLEVSTLFLPKCTNCAVSQCCVGGLGPRGPGEPWCAIRWEVSVDDHLPGGHAFTALCEHSPHFSGRPSCSHPIGPPASPTVALSVEIWEEGSGSIQFPEREREPPAGSFV